MGFVNHCVFLRRRLTALDSPGSPQIHPTSAVRRLTGRWAQNVLWERPWAGAAVIEPPGHLATCFFNEGVDGFDCLSAWAAARYRP